LVCVPEVAGAVWALLVGAVRFVSLAVAGRLFCCAGGCCSAALRGGLVLLRLGAALAVASRFRAFRLAVAIARRLAGFLRLILRLRLIALGRTGRLALIVTRVLLGSAALLLAASALQWLLAAAALRCGAFRRLLGPSRLIPSLTGRLGVGEAGSKHQSDSRGR
jgi:hypothetical protein